MASSDRALWLLGGNIVCFFPVCPRRSRFSERFKQTSTILRNEKKRGISSTAMRKTGNLINGNEKNGESPTANLTWAIWSTLSNNRRVTTVSMTIYKIKRYRIIKLSNSKENSSYSGEKTKKNAEQDRETMEDWRLYLAKAKFVKSSGLNCRLLPYWPSSAEGFRPRWRHPRAFLGRRRRRKGPFQGDILSRSQRANFEAP